MISSINYNQHQILEDIRTLFLKGEQFECDPTFSKGNFYPADSNLDVPIYTFDTVPQYDFVVEANCENLPLPNNSISSLIFDPPFLAKSGKGSIMKNRFGAYPTIKKLWNFYTIASLEFNRIIKPKGYLIWKCQNTIDSGKQWWSVDYIKKLCEDFFDLEDEFILLAKHRMERTGKYTQKHARKFHSYFLVFKRNKESV